MENKDDIVDKLLCVACLCVGRALNKVTDSKMQQYYLEILSEIPLYNNLQSCPSICWECTALLKKAVAFREQIKDCYRILQTYSTENLHECLLTDITRPPHLKVHHNEPISFVTGLDPSAEGRTPQNLWKDENENEDLDPPIKTEKFSDEKVNIDLANDLEIDKTENRFLEVDLNDEIDANTLLEYNQDESQATSEDDVQLSELKVQKKKRDRKKKKRTAKKLTKLKEDGPKVITVELSHEDMLLEREKDIKKDSYIKAEFKCESCILGFNYLKSYQTHLASKHSADLGDYKCPICNTVMTSVESFTAHYKRHLRRYECSMCKKRTMDMKVMLQHFYNAHNVSLKEYKCKICGKISNSIDTHRYHMDGHKARVQCPACDKTFSHRAGLMNHRLAVHEYNNDFPCTICSKVFRWKNSLKRHLDKHDTKEKTSMAFCTPCGISFSSVSSLQRHLRNSLKHVTPHELKFICDHCNKRFADKTKLRDHIEEKHLHKTYQCPICFKPSKNRVGLDQHIRNVHKGRPNNKVCHYCGKGFPTKVQLESHIRTHTGEKPFICEFCPTTFSQQSNLYKHNRQVHLNIKSKRYPINKKPQESVQPTEHQRQLIQFDSERGFVM